MEDFDSSRFTEQVFSTSRFTDTKNGRSRCRENKLASPGEGEGSSSLEEANGDVPLDGVAF